MARALALLAEHRRGRLIETDDDFLRAFAFAPSETTATKPIYLANLFMLIKFFLPAVVADRPATIAEFGVANGGSMLFMAYLAKLFLPSCRVVGFDTFSSFPVGSLEPTIDWHRQEDFSMTTEAIDQLDRQAIELGNVSLVTGDFRQTAQWALPRSDPLALTHIDCDSRESVGAAFELCWPHMMPGGYIVFDDALHVTCPGAWAAVEDIVIRDYGLSAEQLVPHMVFRAPIANGEG